MHGILRAIKTSIVNFWRNILLSTAATLVMVITLTILTVILLVVNTSTVAKTGIEQRVDISVYFNPQTTDDQVKAIESDVQSFPEVSSVTFISAADALASFESEHSSDSQTDQTIRESLQELGTNPLSASLSIQAKQLDEYAAIAQKLGADRYKPYVTKVNYQDNQKIISNLTKTVAIVREVSIGAAILFALIAILVIFNTIRLTIYNRREEVEIMKLVGATNWYIRWPFILESMLYAVIGTAITIGIMVPLFRYGIPPIEKWLGIQNTGINSITYFKLWQLYLLQLGVALLLGITSSYIAIRRYLKV